MSHSQSAAKDIVPVKQKVAYGAGTLTLNLLPASIAIFSTYLIVAFGMDPLLAGIVGALPRLLDAVTDPIMGFITDNTRTFRFHTVLDILPNAEQNRPLIQEGDHLNIQFSDGILVCR